MNVFINDCLLQDDLLLRHLNDQDSFFNSIKNLSLFCDNIKTKKLEYNNKLPIKLHVSASILKKFFEIISNKDLEDLFRIKLSKVMPIYWDTESIQKPNKQYYFFDSTLIPPVSYSINNTSLAEAYEFANKFNDNVLALNFPDSVLSKQKSLLIISVHNSSTGTKSISCADNIELLNEWIEQNLNEQDFIYNKTATIPPTDNQTCLRSRIKFQPTSDNYDGRKKYIEISTGNIWYVDNLHSGNSAHLEVYNKNGSFISEATIDGNYIIKKGVNSHKITKSEKRKIARRI